MFRATLRYKIQEFVQVFSALRGPYKTQFRLKSAKMINLKSPDFRAPAPATPNRLCTSQSVLLADYPSHFNDKIDRIARFVLLKRYWPECSFHRIILLILRNGQCSFSKKFKSYLLSPLAHAYLRGWFACRTLAQTLAEGGGERIQSALQILTSSVPNNAVPTERKGIYMICNCNN